MAKQSPAQKETVERVMHEFKHGELRTGAGKGPKVKNPKQAVAIALHEAGASNQESPTKNRRNLKRTKTKERRGETAEAEAEGKTGRKSSRGSPKSTHGSKVPAGETRAALYERAKRRDLPGRSKMSKDQLAHAFAT